MDEFKNLKSQWENQPSSDFPKNGAAALLNKITFLKKKQKITNAILLLTVAVLIIFFFYVSAYRNVLVMCSLLLMIGSVLLRVIIEMMSISKLNKINVALSRTNFKKQMISYYRKRKIIHFTVTPIIILLYCVGFILLLPDFKANLSSGLYTYIQVSSVVVLLVLGTFIAIQIQRELKVLKNLSE